MEPHVDGRSRLEDCPECHHCERHIHLEEEIVVLEVGFPSMGDEGLEFLDLVAQDDDYMYKPMLFHRDCWGEIYHDYNERMKDEKPVGWPGSLIECDICTSDICARETTGQLREGKLVISARRPNHQTTLRVIFNRGPLFLCIACLAGINDECSLWEEVDHDGECEEGRKVRCWRTGCKERCDRATCARCTSDNVEVHNTVDGYVAVACLNCGLDRQLDQKV
jgi:hypothetical protein